MDVREIKTNLERLGRTQSDLARYLGMTKGQISNLLTGKSRMLLETHQKILAFLENAQHSAGMAETPAPYVHRRPLKSITLAEARELMKNPPPRRSPEDYERIWREISELGEALKRAPVLTGMTDDEILGYDEML